MMFERVGFVGLEIMGKPMARNLLSVGYNLVVQTRGPKKAEELVKEGAEAAGSSREVPEKRVVFCVEVIGVSGPRDTTSRAYFPLPNPKVVRLEHKQMPVSPYIKQPALKTFDRNVVVSTAASESARLLPTYQQILGWTMTDDRCDLICIDAPRAEAIRERLLDDDKAQEAAERGKALSDPTRLTLAAALREGEELCVCDLSWISGRAQNLVSHHLRMLRSYGMVRSRRDGKLVMYSLTDEGRALLSAVLGEETRVRA